ncbi:MAG: AAA family ATPase [Patescibacteria group bacterium]
MIKESNIEKKLVVAIVGMTGAGKTEAASVFVSLGWQMIRFGQITLDELKKRNLPVNETTERMVREELRRMHGMAAFAVMNLPKIDALLMKGPVVIDGLYSWSEYKILKERYGDRLQVLAICASPATRHQRLEHRADRHQGDNDKRFRSFSRAESQSRDYAEIENLEKGGPIAMAEYAIVDEGKLEEFQESIRQIISSNFNRQ